MKIINKIINKLQMKILLKMNKILLIKNSYNYLKLQKKRKVKNNQKIRILLKRKRNNFLLKNSQITLKLII